MDADRTAPGLWLFWPDHSQENPFQTLAYRAFPSGWQVRSAPLDAAMTALAEGRRRVVFHLHWEDAVYRDAPNVAAADSLVDGYLSRLDAFIAGGGRFVWTVHAETPADQRFLDVNARLRQALALRARVVQLHSMVGAARLAPTLGIPAAQVLVTPPGSFDGYYPDDIGKAAARKYFGIAAEAPVFVTLGALRAYKGVEVLLDAFAAVQDTRPDARLIIAGRTGQPAGGRFVRLRPGVLVMPRYIDDATVQYVMRAADFAAFAFRRIMVSSAVLLAESFGLPVIVPDLPTLRESIEHNRNGLVYPAGDVPALARTLQQAIAMPAEQRAQLAEGAMAASKRRDWGAYARDLVDSVMVEELARA